MMNFLSHYYFDKTAQDPYLILGSVLPDLVKNANKDWNLYPQKKDAIFKGSDELSILRGWKRHLKVDLIFHCSPFFFEQTKILKQLLLPILNDSPVRPSFLAHIGLELLLDHILVKKNFIAIDTFYEKLEAVDENILGNFLNKSGIVDLALFNTFFSSFKSTRYLLSYQKIDNISYALQRICMRLWVHPFTEKTVSELTIILAQYKEELETRFIHIFDEIERQLD